MLLRKSNHHALSDLGRWCMRVVIEKASPSPLRSSAFATQFWKTAAMLKEEKTSGLISFHATPGNCLRHDHRSWVNHSLCSTAQKTSYHDPHDEASLKVPRSFEASTSANSMAADGTKRSASFDEPFALFAKSHHSPSGPGHSSSREGTLRGKGPSICGMSSM